MYIDEDSEESSPFVMLTSPTKSWPASYGKKNGMWYASPGNQGWGSKPASRKPSIMEADLGTLSTTSGSIKRSAGRVIRIINNLDHSVQ
uniref:Echinoderm microtubule-associated protein-like CG42247 n=2 Tax=Drosophila TaxID=7215 RepID=A0A6P4E3M8_DRORH